MESAAHHQEFPRFGRARLPKTKASNLEKSGAGCDVRTLCEPDVPAESYQAVSRSGKGVRAAGAHLQCLLANFETHGHCRAARRALASATTACRRCLLRISYRSGGAASPSGFIPPSAFLMMLFNEIWRMRADPMASRCASIRHHRRPFVAVGLSNPIPPLLAPLRENGGPKENRESRDRAPVPIGPPPERCGARYVRTSHSGGRRPALLDYGSDRRPNAGQQPSH